MTDTELPISFSDLDEKELYRSALEDFALPVEKTDKKKVLLAAFVEGGVTWDDYVAQHPSVAPAPAEDPAASVITLDNANPSALSAEDVAPVETVTTTVHVATTPHYNPTDRLLIKMADRDNPSFGFRQYTFTQKNPYVLMGPADADALLRNETGFRMALPSELTEFYG